MQKVRIGEEQLEIRGEPKWYTTVMEKIQRVDELGKDSMTVS